MCPAEERELLQRCRAGEPASWDLFFEAYYGAVGRFVCQLVPDATLEDVEEIAQDAFVAAIRAIDTFRGQSRVQTWLLRIAANKAHDFHNRRLAAKRGAGRAPIPLDDEDPVSGRKLDPPATGRAPDEVLLSNEAMAEVRLGLDRLQEPCRAILELRYFADLDYEAIATVLNLHPKTVSSRLSRCLDRLGRLMQSERDREQVRRAAV